MIITDFCLCVKCFCAQEEVSPEIDPVVEESEMIQEKLMRKRGSAEGYLICKELQKHGIVQSMSRKGNCYDYCIMETFFGRLKNEMFYGFAREYTSFEAFASAIDDYIAYYNKRRIQAKTKWMPPSKFREASMLVS